MLKRILILLALCCPVFYANGAPPSDASVKQLLEITQSPKILDSMMAQITAFMNQSMEQVTEGQKPSPKIQQSIEKRQAEAMAWVKEELVWRKMEPVCVRIYQKSFTQEEVDGIVAFYKTAAGQASINKMPSVVKATVEEMQNMMSPVLDKIREQQREVAAEIKAEKEGKK